ncbi:MAG: sugar transferase [Acidobacteria bacterium]|nr:sugar transferase [Acidobacteriota bacterium]
MNNTHRGPTPGQRAAKRAFDLVLSALGLLLTGWLILLAFIIASLDTRRNGFFTQERIGLHGRRFRVIKIRTMRHDPAITTTVTSDHDPRITRVGRLFRKTKIDELPQLINVLRGDMSFVGPRPDVPGFADELEGNDRIILSVRPGITGPATLQFRDEEAELATQLDPESYNREVIWREKVRINRAYVENYRFWRDVAYIIRTIAPSRNPATRSGHPSEQLKEN